MHLVIVTFIQFLDMAIIDAIGNWHLFLTPFLCLGDFCTRKWYNHLRGRQRQVSWVGPCTRNPNDWWLGAIYSPKIPPLANFELKTCLFKLWIKAKGQFNNVFGAGYWIATLNVDDFKRSSERRIHHLMISSPGPASPPPLPSISCCTPCAFVTPTMT